MKILTNNFGLKILALLCALGVWSYVYITESRTVKLPFPVPVEIRGLDQALVAIIPPENSSVYLSVTAERNSWQSLSQEDFIAYIDLTGVETGNYEAEMKATAKNKALTVNSISPSRITVSIERASTKEVPIKVSTTGITAEGLVVSGTSIDPVTATIKGPQSYLDKITATEAKVELNGESTTVSKNVTLIAIDASGQEVSGVTINPVDVTVEIQITKGGQSKLLPISPKFEGKVATGKWISGYLVFPQSINVTMNSEALDTKFIETKSINVDGLSANKDFTVKLNIPKGIEVDDGSISIKVSVTIDSVATTKDQVLGLNSNGLTNLKVITITPNTVTAVISGSSDALQSANSGNSYIDVDLSNYKTPGTYSIDIKPDMIKLPSGASIVSFAPSAVTFVLENK